MDDLQQALTRLTFDLERILGEQKGQIDFDFEYQEEVTVTGDRIGYARLALELLRVAAPASPTEEGLAGPEDRLLSSPIADYRRDDIPAAPAKMSWTDRALALGCLLFALFAVAAFFRGCAAFQKDIEPFIR